MGNYKPKFRAQVAIYTLENSLSYAKAESQFGVSKGLIGVWVRKLKQDAYLLFEDQRSLNKRPRSEVIMETSRYKRKERK